MSNKLIFEKESYKIVIILILLVISVLLTYYFHFILGSGVIFTHFFYFPIILAAIWWKRKGLIIPIFLSLLLISSYFFAPKLSYPLYEDLLRVLIFMGIGVVVAFLSEEIAKRDKKLREREETFREVFNNINDAVFLHPITNGMPGNFIEVNEVASEMLGYKKEELIHMNPKDIDSPENTAKIPQVMESLQNEGKKTFETVQVNKNGQLIPVEINAHKFIFKGEEMILSIARDISERKKAEQKVKTSEKRYRDLFENMLEGFAYCQMIFDEEKNPIDWIYINVNTAFEQITGLKNISGKKVTEIIPGIIEEQPELFDIYGRVTLTGKPENIEIYFKPLGIWLNISVFRPE
jgi:PAS domain S-box-containing protein